MNTGFKTEQDTDFEGIDLSQLLSLKNQLNQRVSNGSLVFINSEIDLHPESLAYDLKAKNFFLNSVRKRKIIWYHQKTQDFSYFSSGHGR